ncbi:hypothetical protein SAMN02745133_00289 [Desulforamulus putei DSM 12395]|uniref:ComK protein n=1 Tax=Desulforamulus putei DSM 12395 TaxID=1121429 RepID=A0A1M4SZG1_9FIRM|nr:hypothetical protein [Desulforamulus putei]SHE37427.1 hypothetical protein SAMN02745133_00289 [Desulforamulus putei DSM 12395]
MTKNRWKGDFDQIAYFCPVYLPEGDGTEIADNQGNLYNDARNVRSVRKAVCRHFALDYTALRKIFREQGGAGLPPLTLAPGYTLVAVKTRTARCTGDPCYGFIHLQLIDSVTESAQPGEKSRILLKNGLSIGAVSTVKTVKHAIALANSMARNCQHIEQRDRYLADLFYRILKLLEKENKGESRIFKLM